MVRSSALLLMLAWPVGAQRNTPPPAGSISGVVRDAISRLPVEDMIVSKGSRNADARTDAQGRYSLTGLTAAQYTLEIFKAQTPMISTRRTITLAPGQDLIMDLEVTVPGTITGRILDDNKEPIPDAEVMLVSAEYYLGAVKQFFKGTAGTDDQGQYKFQRVQPGTPFRIMARKRVERLPAISDAPANIKLRRPAFAPTFYPNSLAIEGGQQVILGSGEQREGMDIIVQTDTIVLRGRFHNSTDRGSRGDCGRSAVHRHVQHRRAIFHKSLNHNRSGWEVPLLRAAPGSVPRHYDPYARVYILGARAIWSHDLCTSGTKT